jgi:hypothetical protein
MLLQNHFANPVLVVVMNFWLWAGLCWFEAVSSVCGFKCIEAIDYMPTKYPCKHTAHIAHTAHFREYGCLGIGGYGI